MVDGPYGPYRQSERKDIYKVEADKLIAQGQAYPCFCTPEELDKKREEAEAAGLDPKYDGTWRDADPAEVKKRMDAGEPYTVRFKVPEGKVVSLGTQRTVWAILLSCVQTVCQSITFVSLWMTRT